MFGDVPRQQDGGGMEFPKWVAAVKAMAAHDALTRAGIKDPHIVIPKPHATSSSIAVAHGDAAGLYAVTYDDDAFSPYRTNVGMTVVAAPTVASYGRLPHAVGPAPVFTEPNSIDMYRSKVQNVVGQRVYASPSTF
jgi:hypothetical protein